VLGHRGAILALGQAAAAERCQAVVEALLSRSIAALWLHPSRLGGADVALLARELSGQGHIVVVAADIPGAIQVPPGDSPERAAARI
jgi:hypothetical protein